MPIENEKFSVSLLKLFKDPMIFDRVMPHKLMKKMKFFVLTYEQHLLRIIINACNYCDVI